MVLLAFGLPPSRQQYSDSAGWGKLRRAGIMRGCVSGYRMFGVRPPERRVGRKLRWQVGRARTSRALLYY
jgi:hypothetical protein